MQPKGKEEHHQQKPQQSSAVEAAGGKPKGGTRPRVKGPKENSGGSSSSSGNGGKEKPTSSQGAEKKVKEQVEKPPRKQITAEDIKRYESYVGQKWTGRCKWFNVTKGFGFIVPDHEEARTHGDDVFVHQSALVMEGFRSLGEDEAVEFTVKVKSNGDEEGNVGGGGLEAENVLGKDGAPIKGHDIRPMGKKIARERAFRCYNCGRIGHHKASKCKQRPAEAEGGEHAKLCYHCHEPGHLLANCPKYTRHRDKRSRGDKKGGNGNGAEEAPHTPQPKPVE